MGFRPFSWGNFKGMPDVPENECSGVFDAESCYWCSDYERCKDAEYVDEWDRLAREDDE